MTKYATFEELKKDRKELVAVVRKNGMLDGLTRLLTELYPDEAHFIYELLQNAEDKEATQVSFKLFNDKTMKTGATLRAGSHYNNLFLSQYNIDAVNEPSAVLTTAYDPGLPPLGRVRLPGLRRYIPPTSS